MRLTKKKIIALLRQADGRFPRCTGAMRKTVYLGDDKTGYEYCAIGVIAHLCDLDDVLTLHTSYGSNTRVLSALGLVNKRQAWSPIACKVIETNDAYKDPSVDFTFIANRLAQIWGIE